MNITINYSFCGSISLIYIHVIADGMDIEEQNQMLKEGILCTVCQSNKRDTVFLPCGHMITCHVCAPSIQKCTRCEADIRGTVKSFMS